MNIPDKLWKKVIPITEKTKKYLEKELNITIPDYEFSYRWIIIPNAYNYNFVDYLNNSKKIDITKWIATSNKYKGYEYYDLTTEIRKEKLKKT